MKKLALISLILVTGCSKGMIKVDAVEGLINDVSTRHDMYVSADSNLSTVQKATYLRSTSLLKDIVAAAKQ